MFSTSVLEKPLCSALQGPLLVRPSSASAPRGQRVLQLAGLHPPCATSPAFNSTPNSQSKQKGKHKVEKAAKTKRITYISRSLRFLLTTVRVILV